jgi:type IV fimbrial biogenesis protein FimT
MTLIELLITLAVGAVLLVVAVPNLNTFVKNNRIVSATNDFVAAVNIARTEAIRRGVTVVLCRTTQPLAATPSCDRTGSSANDWSTGWLMYATDGDIDERDYASATDDLIRVGQATGGSVELTSNGTGNQWLAINRDGTLREAGNTAAYAVCDDRGYDYGRLIRINATGRAQVAFTTSDSATNCTPN